MQPKNTDTKGSKETLILPPGVTWEEITRALKEEKRQQFFKTISPATFKYILEEKNRSKAVRSLIKTLKKIDSQNANQKYAEMLLDVMNKIAEMMSKSA